MSPAPVDDRADLGLCLYCGEADGSYRSNLCRTCYQTPGVREQYGQRQRGGSFLRLLRSDFGDEDDAPDVLPGEEVPVALLPPPERPTDARPGSVEKVTEFRRRLAAGRGLFHPDDARLDLEAESGRSVPERDALEDAEPEMETWVVSPRMLARLGADAYVTMAERFGVKVVERLSPLPPLPPVVGTRLELVEVEEPQEISEMSADAVADPLAASVQLPDGAARVAAAEVGNDGAMAPTPPRRKPGPKPMSEADRKRRKAEYERRRRSRQRAAPDGDKPKGTGAAVASARDVANRKRSASAVRRVLAALARDHGLSRLRQLLAEVEDQARAMLR